ncbi:DUF3757 domain-containing protein [Pseudomonas sp.]|uniref:DUF3757 domain-containing protein n=2 Tax=Pseudomonas TaxID=286 RepID=UPI00391CCE50
MSFTHRIVSAFWGRPLTRSMSCLLLLLSCAVIQTSAAQGCPYPSTVRYEKNRFQALDGRTLWRSPSVPYDGYVERFVGAVFIPKEGDSRDEGYFEQCIYSTNRGQSVALRYSAKNGPYSFSLTATSHWRLVEDPLGRDVYICEDRQPDNCSFTVKQLRR